MTQESAQQRKPLREKTWIAWVLLAIIVACQLVRITTTFEAREGFHSDESWSYGFANSTDGGYIYREMLADGETRQQWDSEPTIKNMDAWESSEVLYDYLTVQPDQRFDYSAVLYNSRYDLSPPLYYLVLHTVCSFFPNSFSWWYAFSINIAAFLLTQLFMFLLGCRLFHSRWLALLPPGFYGFTIGALNCFIFLRPYALLVTLVVIFCYLNICLRDAGYRHCIHLYILLFAITFLGAYTNVYFLVFAFFVTVGFCIYLLICRRGKAFLAYGLTVLSGVSCALIACISQIISTLQYSGGTAEASEALTGPLWRFLYCQSSLWLETMGVGISTHYREIAVTVLFILVVLAILLAGFCFLCRNEAWFKLGWGHVKNFFKRVARKFKRTAHEPGNGFWFWLILLVAVSGSLVFVSQTVNVLGMNSTVGRYIFYLMPCFCLGLVWLLWQLCIRIVRKRPLWQVLLVTVIALLAILSDVNTSCPFMFYRDADYDSTMEQLVQDNDVVLVSSSSWQLTYWSSRLMNADRYFDVTVFDAEAHTDALVELDDDRPIYLVMDTLLVPDDDGNLGNGWNIYSNPYNIERPHTDYTVNEYIDYLRGTGLVDHATYIGKESCYTGTVVIYRLR